MKRKTTNTDGPREVEGDCIVPPAIPKPELHKLMFRHSEIEAQAITDYMASQARDEKVLHLEKVASERIFDRQHDVWAVHTDKERWWVVTQPTNLYSQALMPSLDYTLSFHIGLMARMAARREPQGSEAEQELLLVTNRKIVQAGEAFDKADEAEEFQAVAMRLREGLLALVRELVEDIEVLQGEERPKMADFPAWNELIANAVAPGSSLEHVRGYLKTTAERAWRLVNSLTHGSNATRADAELALSAVTHVLGNYAIWILRKKSGAPERCGRCGSYQISVDWRPDLDGKYVSRCEACGAEKMPMDGEAANDRD
jgi:hypothetical protein